MRLFLNRLYNVAAYAAAFFMVCTFLMVLAGVIDRILGIGFQGTDMYAGYCMAAAGFFALAHTLKRGEHIRVMLLLEVVNPKTKRILEIWSIVVAGALSGVWAFYSAKLAYESWVLNDISTANDATPMWIPQLSMAIGSLILFVAFIDDFILELKGKRVVIASDEPLRNE